MIEIKSTFHTIKNVDYVGPHTLSTTTPNGVNYNITIPQVIIDKKPSQPKAKEEETHKNAEDFLRASPV